MDLLICIGLGLSIGFILHSNYFLFRVSKGLSLKRLWQFTQTDPVDDGLLYYTFFNLLLCRVCLLITSLGVALLTGGVIWKVMQ